MDYKTGSILDAIDDLKIREDTIVIWTSDKRGTRRRPSLPRYAVAPFTHEEDTHEPLRDPGPRESDR